MAGTEKAEDNLRRELDKSLATVLATREAGDLYFIGSEILTGVTVFLLTRFAEAYVERLGLKALAEKCADASLSLISAIREKLMAQELVIECRQQVADAMDAIRRPGYSSEVEVEVKRLLARALLEAGAIRSQAQDTAERVASAFRIGIEDTRS